MRVVGNNLSKVKSWFSSSVFRQGLSRSLRKDEAEAAGKPPWSSATVLQPKGLSLSLCVWLSLCVSQTSQLMALGGYSSLQVELEQYPTGPHIASRMLYTVLLCSLSPCLSFALFSPKAQYFKSIHSLFLFSLFSFCFILHGLLKSSCLWACVEIGYRAILRIK